MRSLGLGNFVFYFSSKNNTKQKQFISLGPDKIVCYIYFVISYLFIYRVSTVFNFNILNTSLKTPYIHWCKNYENRIRNKEVDVQVAPITFRFHL